MPTMDGRGAIQGDSEPLVDSEENGNVKTDAKQALPKFKNANAFAAHQTFVAPILQSLAWKAQQFSPRQIGYNILSSNGIGQALMQYKFNHDFAKSPLNRQFASIFGGPGALGSGSINIPAGGFATTPGGDQSAGIARVVTEGLKSGFNAMIKELRNIRQTVMALGRIGMATNEQEQKTTSAIDELAKKFETSEKDFKVQENKEDDTLDEQKFKAAETNEESKVSVTQPGSDNTGNTKKTGLFGNILKNIADPEKWLEGAGILAIFGKLKSSVLGIGKVLGKVGKGLVNFEKLFRKNIFGVFDGIEKVLGRVGKLGRFIEPLLEIIGKFGKFIPIIGEFILAITTIFDAFKGFITEYKKSHNVFNALVGMVKGVIKGLVEIPKIFAVSLKWLTEEVVRIFGFKNLANKIKNYHLGDEMDKLLDKGFTLLTKSIEDALTPTSKLISDILQIIGDAVKNIIASIFKIKPDLSHGPIGAAASYASQAAEELRKGAEQAGHEAATATRKRMHKPSHGTTDSTDMSNEARAILDTLSDAEGADYNTLEGGGTFDDLSHHPNRKGPHGTTTAAGRYQMIHKTWDQQAEKLGLPDMSHNSQDKAGIDLAITNYKHNTGRNLIDDAKAGKIQWSALSQWDSMPGQHHPYGTEEQLTKSFKSHMEDEKKKDAQLTQKQHPSKVSKQALSIQDKIGLLADFGLSRAPSITNNTTNNINAPTVVSGGGLATPKPSARQDRGFLGLDVPRA